MLPYSTLLLKCYLTYPNGYSKNYFYRFFSIYSRVKLTSCIISLYPRGSWFEQTKINTILGCYNTFYYLWPKGFWENGSLFIVFLVLSQYGPTLPQGFMLSTDLSLHNLRVLQRKIQRICLMIWLWNKKRCAAHKSALKCIENM